MRTFVLVSALATVVCVTPVLASDQPTPIAKGTFKAFDRNADGVIDADEFAHAKRLRAATIDISLPDLNKDGAGDRNELRQGVIAAFDALDSDRNGTLTLAEHPPRIEADEPVENRQNRLYSFNKMDADGDGVVTRAEFLGHYEEMTFALFDTNRDGLVTAADRKAGSGGNAR